MILAEAFMKRNDLKKQIATLTGSATQNLWQDKALPINFNKGTKVNPQVAYAKTVELMDQLMHLNVAIATANSANNGILRDLETTTARIALVEKVLATAEMYPGDKVKAREYIGNEVASVTNENEWLVDPQALQSELATLQDRKRALEKTLAHNNFVTEVVI